MKLSKKLKLGDLILVKDDGYQKSHLAVLLGINPASDRNVALVKWIDGKGDTSLVFISDLDKRFVPVKIEKVVPAEREIMITEMIIDEPQEVEIGKELTIVIGKYRLVLKELNYGKVSKKRMQK